MAGEWLKLECSTPDKPETFAITTHMGWDDPDLTVGKLFRVWRWFDQQTIDGNARGVTTALLDRIAGATGFAQAMINVGWLRVEEGGIALPNFEKHNGATAKSRAQTAKRVANHRAENQCNAPNVTDALAREEKKREELKPKEANASVNSEAGASEIDADDSNATRKVTPKSGESNTALPSCPVGTIVNLYHQHMPENPRVRVLDDARKKAIGARWRQAARLECKPFGYATESDGIAAWERFFIVCASSAFLTGKAKPQPGKPPFLADIDFLMSPAGFKSCLENKYHREAE